MMSNCDRLRREGAGSCPGSKDWEGNKEAAAGSPTAFAYEATYFIN
jgi:hypothetical protein